MIIILLLIGIAWAYLGMLILAMADDRTSGRVGDLIPDTLPMPVQHLAQLVLVVTWPAGTAWALIKGPAA